jgi:hypothetical protein
MTRLMPRVALDITPNNNNNKRQRFMFPNTTTIALDQLDGPLDLARELALGNKIARGGGGEQMTAHLDLLTLPTSVPTLSSTTSLSTNKLTDYVELLQVLPKELEPMLYRGLQIWDGESTSHLLVLLQRVRPCRYEQLHRLALAPLGLAFNTLPPSSKHGLITALSILAFRWATRRWAGFQSGEQLEAFASEAVPRLQRFVQQLCLTGLVLDKDSPVLALACVFHLQTLVETWKRRATQVPLTPPLGDLCSRLLLSPSLLGVAGACKHLAELDRAFQAETSLMDNANKARAAQQEFEIIVGEFRRGLLEETALRETSTLGKVLNKAGVARGPSVVASALGIMHSALFSSLRRQCAQELQAEDVDQLDVFLKWLAQQRGVVGPGLLHGDVEEVMMLAS